MHRCLNAQRLVRLVALVVACLMSVPDASAKTVTIHGDAAFRALGTIWGVFGARWGEIEGRWMVSAAIRPMSPTGPSYTENEIYAALCPKLLEFHPGAPTDMIGAKDIFRADLMLLSFSMKQLKPLPSTITVEDGVCQIKEGEQVFLPTYPGRLAGWKFVAMNYQADDDIQRIMFVFQPQDGSDVDLGGFDFTAACTAILADPSIQSIKELLVKQHPDVNVDPESMLVVAKEAAKQGIFIGSIFNTAGGNCVERKN